MRFTADYNRLAAVLYAHRWAFGRNPKFYDYEDLGGDCTNFASQCIYAGSGVMNFTPTYGWYYIDANQKAPAWTGVEYLWNFLTRRQISLGPVGEPCDMEDLRPGDLIQLRFKEEGYHTGEHSGGRPQLRCRQPPTGHLRIQIRPISPHHRDCPAVVKKLRFCSHFILFP